MARGSEIIAVGFPGMKAGLVAAGAILCVVAAAIFFLFDPARVAIFPPCLFHQFTGLDCPGCGAQRALHQLLHGNVIAALRLNAMFVASLPLCAWFGARFMVKKWRNEPAELHFKWLGFYVAAWIVFGVLRNLPLPVFAWFAA